MERVILFKLDGIKIMKLMDYVTYRKIPKIKNSIAANIHYQIHKQ